MRPTTRQPGTTDDHGSLRRLATLLRPHGWRLTVVGLMLIGLAVVNMAVPASIALLLNDVFPNQRWPLLWLILGGILAVYLLRNLLYFGSKYTAVSIGEGVSFRLRNRLFERLQQMSLRFYKQNQPGKLSSRVMNDSFVVQSFIQDDLPTLLQASFRFICIVAIIYAVNWKLALVSTIVLPLHLIAFARFKRPIKSASGVAQEHLAVVQGNLIEKFLGVEVVKACTAEQRENDAFTDAIDASRRSQLRSKVFHVTQKVVGDLLVGLGTIGLLCFGAFQVMKRHDPMAPGTFIAFFGYVGMLYPTVLELTSGFAKLTRTTASVDRVFEVLESTEGERPSFGPTLWPTLDGRVKFDGVSFAYEDGVRVLHDVSFEVEPGQVCAIVGPSGAGKTTLVNLLPRFMEPTEGRVLVDGVDVREVDVRHLRSTIGVAFQECFLFNSTIFENLRYARPDASIDEIVLVARRTGAHDFILSLPDGYSTVVGDQGLSLSRGEKQRITLTRAMLSQPRVLILDEATASLDGASEDRIVPEILDFMRDRTTLMITHRPEMLRHANHVICLEKGRVVFQGRPEDLPIDALRDVSPYRLPVAEKRGDASESRGIMGPWRRAVAVLLAATVGWGVSAQAIGDDAAPAEQPPTPETAAVESPAAPKPTSPTGKFVALPGVNTIAVQDLIDVVVTKLQATHGYELAGEADAATLPAIPDGVLHARSLVRRRPGEATRVLQIGFRVFRSQPIHLWMYGQVDDEGGAQANPDTAALEKAATDAQQANTARNDTLTIGDLRAETITLSYAEVDRALAVLKTLGYEVIDFNAAASTIKGMQLIEPSKPADPKKLPIIMGLPSTAVTSLVGGTKTTAGSFGITMTPSVATELPDHTHTAPIMKLVVLYDPARPEQLGALKDRITTTIDLPARQILIEAMVLEISETGLKQLGVEWELESPGGKLDALRVGRLPAFLATNDEVPTVDVRFRDIFGEFRAKVQALVREGKAEVLSRPSVLALDNRQASIRVGEEIPVATSASGVRGGDKLTFDFKYIPVGILLNTRPRVDARGEMVSMQIDGIVSAQVPGQDLVVTDSAGNELVRAPRISTRRVQTYTRIANNTPFIIGGLISKDETEQVDKVPLLGDIPIVGNAFRSTRKDLLKREVIIVITPFVLPEPSLVGRTLPKDEDAFDSFDHLLFRDAYRLRAEDVFDLSFLANNPKLAEARAFTNALVRRNPHFADIEPFAHFVGRRIPGEEILVYRQMYEVIKRKSLSESIRVSKLIFFKPDAASESGFRVQFLSPYLRDTAEVKTAGRDADDLADVFGRLKGKAVALTYTVRDDGADPAAILRQPVPEVRVIDCPDRESWEHQLWQLNQPDEQGRQRHTILLQDGRDLTRLKRAVLVKKTVHLNANRRSLTLDNFALGRLLLMPTVNEQKVNLIDAETAKYFFLTEMYYSALRQEMSNAAAALKRAKDDPRVRRYLVDEANGLD